MLQKIICIRQQLMYSSYTKNPSGLVAGQMLFPEHLPCVMVCLAAYYATNADYGMNKKSRLSVLRR